MGESKALWGEEPEAGAAGEEEVAAGEAAVGDEGDVA